jgi:hypothetical protein
LAARDAGHRFSSKILVHLATPAIFLLSMLLAYVNVTLAALSWILTAVVEGAIHRLWPTTNDNDATEYAAMDDDMAASGADGASPNRPR